MAIKCLVLFLTLLLIFDKLASALYFPQSDLSIRIPYELGSPSFPNKNNPRNGTRIILELNLIKLRTLKSDSTISNNVTYQILPPNRDIARLDWNQEHLILYALPESGNPRTIFVQAKDEDESEAFLNIKILSQPEVVPEDAFNCTDYLRYMCFWNESRYKIYENQPETMLGTIGPKESGYKFFCSGYQVTDYQLLNETSAFYVRGNEIYANDSLDRDSISPPKGVGSRLNIEVRCVVWEEITGIQYTLDKALIIDVLDQNDNPPISQSVDEFDVYLTEFLKGERLDERDLIITDADEVSTNTLRVDILEDYDNFFNLTYDILDIDHPVTPPPSTAVIVGLYSKSDVLPKSPYRVIVQVKDESLLPGFGNDTKNLTLTFYGPQHLPTPTTNGLPAKLRHISYPPRAYVPRSASLYYRVAQPVKRVGSNRANFEIRGPEAFAVTRRGGIVYVADPELLQFVNSNFSLRVFWHNAEREFFATIELKMFESAETCKGGRFHINSCATAKNLGECKGRCGIATGSENKIDDSVDGCVWRESLSNSSVMTRNYETCSPDLKFCPDNTCDELEDLDLRICPQDCAIEKVQFGEVNRESDRGIYKGAGVCFCEDYKRCQCAQIVRQTQNRTLGKGEKPLGQIADQTTNTTGTELKFLSVFISECGLGCIGTIVCVAFLIVVAIIGSIIVWRDKRTYRQREIHADHSSNSGSEHCDAPEALASKAGEASDAGTGTEFLQPEYAERAGDGLQLGLSPLADGTLPNLHNSSFDPKWEFPRHRLKIEQVLGEGEFGRVLRAKATDIAGQPGETTVAVKTLKSNACASELADLLSEYQMLKEVRHPNVVKLLGACTVSGGPIYVIIEFAENGSLRNYLRSFRYYDSERKALCSTPFLSSMPGTSKEQELFIASSPIKPSLTARDIISFAWQISKGMSYLAEIKLVHRDLAARNVLLAAGKVCKISDFGLTRDVYEDDAYFKRSKGRVPVKWMALESLVDNIYTSKSDVWSFGILLWELVTLGSSPYPGINVHNLFSLLKEGYRMERPSNCSPELYKLMSSCWYEEPGMRPTFKELTYTWERMLEESIDYLDLNYPRTVHNQTYESLHTLESPCSSTDSKRIGMSLVRSTSDNNINQVNYLNKPFFGEIPKPDRVNKLDSLLQETLISSGSESLESSFAKEHSTYVNDMIIGQTESPIKRLNACESGDSQNELDRASTNGPRPRSYVDMQLPGNTSAPDSEDLLMTFSVNENTVVNNFEV